MGSKLPLKTKPPSLIRMLCVLFQVSDSVGEILLSLSYLPTAERLTVVVVKAKNLVWTNEKATAGECLAKEPSCQEGRQQPAWS